jgi:uncharacterized protein
MNIKDQIETLKELQRIETETVGIQSVLSGISDRVAVLETRLGEYQGRLRNQETQLEALKKEYRGMEMDAKDLQSRMKKAKGRLNTVKTNREYQALQKAIDEMKGENSRLEDDMLARLDRIEGAEKELAQLREEYDAFRKQMTDEKAAVSAEAASGEQKLGELSSSRDKVAREADQRLIDRFQRVRRISTLAVAPVSQAVCQGCNMNIPPQLFNELQRFDNLHNCPHCQRIIYWEKPPEPDVFE